MAIAASRYRSKSAIVGDLFVTQTVAGARQRTNASAATRSDLAGGLFGGSWRRCRFYVRPGRGFVAGEIEIGVQ